MLHKASIVALSAFIIALVVISFLFVSFNYRIALLQPVNESFRSFFDKSLLLRRAFMLNQPGDARSDYYSARPFSKLIVEVYISAGVLYPSTLELLKNGLGEVVNKPGGISIVEKNLTQEEASVTDKFLAALGKDIPAYPQSTAVMRIYVLSTYAPHPSLLGLTINAYGFAIFKGGIESSSDHRWVDEDLEKETILHEIGHLLGAEHLENENCIMNKFVDVPNDIGLNFVPTKYCYEDLQALKQANPN